MFNSIRLLRLFRKEYQSQPSFESVLKIKTYANNKENRHNHELMIGSPHTSAEHNYQNAFRILVCNANWSNCLSIRFGNSMFA